MTQLSAFSRRVFAHARLQAWLAVLCWAESAALVHCVGPTGHDGPHTWELR